MRSNIRALYGPLMDQCMALSLVGSTLVSLAYVQKIFFFLVTWIKPEKLSAKVWVKKAMILSPWTYMDHLFSDGTNSISTSVHVCVFPKNCAFFLDRETIKGGALWLFLCPTRTPGHWGTETPDTRALVHQNIGTQGHGGTGTWAASNFISSIILNSILFNTNLGKQSFFPLDWILYWIIPLKNQTLL